MDNQFEITASHREMLGKSNNRRLRRQGKVPGVLYGGAGDAVSLTMDGNEIWTHLQHEAFHSHVLTLKIDGRTESVVLRDVQYHPFKPRAVHVDFLRILADHVLRMRVPIHFKGQEIAVGVKQRGGTVFHLETEVEIECLPRDLPEYLEVDISGLDLDQSVRLSEVPLPAGVTIPELELGADHDRQVVTLYIPRAIEEAVVGETPAAPVSETGDAKPAGEGQKAASEGN